MIAVDFAMKFFIKNESDVLLNNRGIGEFFNLCSAPVIKYLYDVFICYGILTCRE
jgi:hypothetical protein